MQPYNESMKYRRWRELLRRNGIDVKSEEELYTVHKPDGEALFILLRMHAVDPDGVPLLPTVMLRGHFVSVLICLTNRETGQRFLLLVKQRRVADGSYFYEHPAGMCDSDTDPYAVAVREVEEETGLVIGRDDLHRLNQELLYSSPGLLDEAGFFFYYERTLPESEIARYRNRQTGAVGEHEYIRTHICTLDEAKRLIRNTNGLLHLYLYEAVRGAASEDKNPGATHD